MIMKTIFDRSEVCFAALSSAIDEGDVSPDVVGFDRDAFLEEFIEGWRQKKSGNDNQ